MKKIITAIICMAALVVAMSFTPGNKGGLITLIFEHYIGGQSLQLDKVLYQNNFGQSYTVTKFKYYIGNITLKTTVGDSTVFKDYYLINDEEEASKKITLANIPAGQYTSMGFIIGVDSIDNCSGAQSGALDPINAMFWAWNTGYVFLKLEGKSASATPGDLFEFHIGGYRQPYNCIRHITLAFDKPLVIGQSVKKEVHIKTDAGKILNGSNKIDLSKLSSVTDFHNATTIADNYADMFSVIEAN